VFHPDPLRFPQANASTNFKSFNGFSAVAFPAGVYVDPDSTQMKLVLLCNLWFLV